MKALIFGSGNIGRGFIGQILKENNYQIIFVDVNDSLVEEIKLKKEYSIFLADEVREEIKISNVSAIHSSKEVDKLEKAIIDADLITTAVGPNILGAIGKSLAGGIKKRLKQEDIAYLNIMACENSIGATDSLKASLYSYLNEEERQGADKYIGFPNTAVDRIVPIQPKYQGLDIIVEPYYEWIAEKEKFKGSPQPIKGIKYVGDLEAYIERKLFTVNTGHAATAYIGNAFGYKKIDKAIGDERILNKVLGVLGETSSYLVTKFDLGKEKQAAYVETIIKRFKNPYISDDIHRVARAPIRKISPQDRFLFPARVLIKMGKEASYLAETIAYALKYFCPADSESVELYGYVEEYGPARALKKYSGLEEDSTLTKLVEEKYRKI